MSMDAACHGCCLQSSRTWTRKPASPAVEIFVRDLFSQVNPDRHAPPRIIFQLCRH